MNAPALITIASLFPVGTLQVDPAAGMLLVNDPLGFVVRARTDARALREMADKLREAADQTERHQHASAIQAANARGIAEDALSDLYQSDSITDASARLAERLTQIFGQDKQSAAAAVSEYLTPRLLRSLEPECIGSAPGSAIAEAVREYKEAQQ
jgi:hypothetical protein